MADDQAGSGPHEGGTVDEGPRADDQAPLATGKTIVLFSDGTGNSSAKLFKTNVYRLYEALDLGPDRHGRRTQVAYYDNGVGTSSNKLLATLGGVFGWGLKRNLVHLYLFLCRNYDEGDRIYAFGFSRGAFTIRLLVALVCSQGVVGYEDERELARNARDAYRRFASSNNPDMFPWLARLIRWARDLVIASKRRLADQDWNATPAHRPDVDFVGVWDTVAAYGGPVAEVTRAIDKWVWPLTMTDYRLDGKVGAARHALALDDERDSFQPLLWDEVHEDRCASLPGLRAEERERYRTRLRQVWFAGMHSDVGGGYPDDSLAYVSLNWMIGELGNGLRLLPDMALHIRSFANAFGPIHDSRQGLGGYYRYQPRKVAALLHPAAGDLQRMRETLILRDPTIGEKGRRPQGLLLGCKVHESVVSRIGAGTDNYAPIGLPENFEVVADEDRLGSGTARRVASGAVSNLHAPEVARDRAERQEAVWDYVWFRRLTYFATVALTCLMIAFPLWIGRVEDGPPGQDGRYVLGTLLRWAGGLVPGFAAPWFEAFSVRPLWFVALLAPILMLLAASRRLEQTLRDRTRRLWWSAMRGKVAELPEGTAVRAFRNGLVYQWSLQKLKWRVAPTIIGVGVLLAIPYLAALAWTQVRLAVNEPLRTFCAVRPTPPHRLPLRATGFRAENPCFDTAAVLERGRRYRITFELDPSGPGGRRVWTDGRLVVPARGSPSSGFPSVWSRGAMGAAAPFRRVVPARWLEPVVEIRPTSPGSRLAPGVDIERLVEVGTGRDGVFVGEVTPRRSGRLYVFLNDAAPPVGPIGFFYGPAPRRGTNRGSATICVEAVGARPAAEGAQTGAPDRCAR